MKKKYLILFLLFLILIIAAFLRFNKLDQSLDFGGDLGRDALAAKRIIVDHKLTLIGPRASAGDFYLGPFYFYFISLPLLIFNLSPLGPVYWSAFFGVLSVVLVFVLGKDLWGEEQGLLGAFLYSISPVVVSYSRVSGNYTHLPFFALFAVWTFWRWLKQRRPLYLLLVAVSCGIGLQLHYSAILLLLFFFLCLIWHKINLWQFKSQLLLSALAFVFLMSPLFFFDLRHHWINSRGLLNYFFGESGSQVRQLVGSGSWSFKGSLIFFTRALLKVLWPFSEPLGRFTFLGLAILAGLLFLKRRLLSPASKYLLALLLFAIVFSSFYKGYLADYYLSLVFFVPILLLADFLVSYFRKGGFFLIAALLVLGGTLSPIVRNISFSQSARSLTKIEKIAKLIFNDVKNNSKFNIFLKRETPFWSTASEYRYLVEVMGKRALEPTDYKTAEFLYYVAEVPVIEPLKTNNWEVTEFGPKKITGVWTIENVTIFRMER